MTVLLAALLVRALVPEGFMPAQGELVELCTEHGLQRMLVEPQTGEVLGQEEGAASQTCPWSLMLPTLAPPALPPASVAAFPERATAPWPTLPKLAPDWPLLPPARAPPRLI